MRFSEESNGILLKPGFLDPGIRIQSLFYNMENVQVFIKRIQKRMQETGVIGERKAAYLFGTVEETST